MAKAAALILMMMMTTTTSFLYCSVRRVAASHHHHVHHHHTDQKSTSEDENGGGGLSYSFYEESCPLLEHIVGSTLAPIVAGDPGQAAGIMRILFHDCFVLGCDASILLRSPGATTEQTATPNVNSLRSSSLRLIDQLKDAVEEACPGTVSCADLISLATVKSLAQIGGPYIPLPMGRRDGYTAATNQTVISNIPAPTFGFSQLRASFASKGLSVTDLVALSGSHTIGRAHCRSVDFQITPAVSSELEQPYASALQAQCLPQAANAQKVVQMDVDTPQLFDTAYYAHVLQGRVPFHSDAALLQDANAAQLVQQYAQATDAFIAQFATSLVKLSTVGALVGTQGEIRLKCTSPNNNNNNNHNLHS